MELAIGQFAPFAPVGYPTRFLFNEEEEAEEESKRWGNAQRVRGERRRTTTRVYYILP